MPIRGTLCLVFSRSNPDPVCPLHPTSVPWVAHAFIYIPYNFCISPEIPAELSSLSSCVSDHLFSVFQVLASFMSPPAPASSALPARDDGRSMKQRRERAGRCQGLGGLEPHGAWTSLIMSARAAQRGLGGYAQGLELHPTVGRSEPLKSVNQEMTWKCHLRN